MIAEKYTDPVFLDQRVQAIQTDLEALSWIDDVHQIVQQDQTPISYMNDGSEQYLRVMPEDNAISFFIVNSAIEQVEEYHHTCPLSLIVWGDLRKIDPTKEYNYTEELLLEVIDVLTDKSCYDIEINMNTPFEGFEDLDKVVNQNTMLPYFAFRVNFTMLIPLCKSVDVSESTVPAETAPVIVSIEVGTVDSSTWVLTFDKTVEGQSLPGSFAVSGITFTVVTLMGDETLQLTSSTPAIYGTSYSLTFTKDNILQGESGLPVETFTQAVTNNVAQTTVRMDSTLVTMDSTLVTMDNGI